MFRSPVDLFTALLAVFSAVLTGTTFVQIRYLRQADETARISAEAAQDSADAAIAAQRPWLRLNFTLAGDLMLLGETVYLPFRITIKNTGNSPATHVQTCVALACGASGFSFRQAANKIPPLGVLSSYTLFPEEEFSINQYGSLFDNEVEAALQSGQIANRVVIGGIISVKYRVAGSGLEGETTKSFLIGAKDSFFEMFDPRKLPYPKDQLILMEQPVSSTK